MRQDINLKLRASRVLQGLTQEDSGNKIDRSQTWVCELERGLVEPSDLDVALICRVLGTKPENIFPMEPDNRVNAPGGDESEALFTARGEIRKPP